MPKQRPVTKVRKPGKRSPSRENADLSGRVEILQERDDILPSRIRGLSREFESGPNEMEAAVATFEGAILRLPRKKLRPQLSGRRGNGHY
jgi:hypothetical protein